MESETSGRKLKDIANDVLGLILGIFLFVVSNAIAVVIGIMVYGTFSDPENPVTGGDWIGVGFFALFAGICVWFGILILSQSRDFAQSLRNDLWPPPDGKK